MTSSAARRLAGAMASALLLATTASAAGPEPAPPYPAPAPPYSAPLPPPPRTAPPVVPQVAPPPPLSPLMRVAYAPFYAAGLVLRYGVYYVIVAPLEVFGRALNYGAEGGVAEPERGGDAT